MDRSFLPKKIILFTQILLLCFLLQPVQAEENTNKIKKNPGKKIVKPLSVITGTFIGTVNFIDPEKRYFRAVPSIPGTEKIFYIDQKTIFKIKWKKITLNELLVADKIKVIYFRKGQTLLADIVSIEKDLFFKSEAKKISKEKKNNKETK